MGVSHRQAKPGNTIDGVESKIHGEIWDSEVRAPRSLPARRVLSRVIHVTALITAKKNPMNLFAFTVIACPASSDVQLKSALRQPQADRTERNR